MGFQPPTCESYPVVTTIEFLLSPCDNVLTMKFKGTVKGSNVALPSHCTISDGAEVLVSTTEARNGEVIGKFRIVAFLDILGFSQAMQTPSLIPDLVQALRDSHDQADRLVKSGQLHAGHKGDQVNLSDTILIAMELPQIKKDLQGKWETDKWQKDTSDRLLSFLIAAQWVLTEMFWAGWPLRGGIAVGECFVDSEERIIVGPCICEAQKLEKGQEWSGCAFSEDAAALVKLHHHTDFLIDYLVPTKSKDNSVRNLLLRLFRRAGPQKYPALEWRKALWTRRGRHSATVPHLDDFVRGRFAANGKSAHDNKVKRMCDNTLRFLKQDAELASEWAVQAARSSLAPD